MLATSGQAGGSGEPRRDAGGLLGEEGHCGDGDREPGQEGFVENENTTARELEGESHALSCLDVRLRVYSVFVLTVAVV